MLTLNSEAQTCTHIKYKADYYANARRYYIAWYRPTQEYLFTLILTRTQLRREIWINARFARDIPE